MKGQLKEAAEMEGTLIEYLFKDPVGYLKQIIAILMDETHGRDRLILIIKEFNKKMPFMVLNDYRVAQATNSLRRADLLKDLIFK